MKMKNSVMGQRLSIRAIAVMLAIFVGAAMLQANTQLRVNPTPKQSNGQGTPVPKSLPMP
jgi:hypothetical protein